MRNNQFNQKFWENKYTNNQIGWDIGYASTPITNYLDQLNNKEISILIPGAGNAYEAEYLFNNGFKNITVLDVAKQPLINFRNRIPSFPVDNLIQINFFDHKKKYDLIIEQTFFCSLSPDLRINYIKKMSSLLNKKGKLIGLLFDFPLTEEGPPFGGSKGEYQKTFLKKLEKITLERCYNSIKPRQGRELFIIFEKK